MGDPGAIARILRILLDNALRFSPGRRDRSGSSPTTAATAPLEVSDHGPGVPEPPSAS